MNRKDFLRLTGFAFPALSSSSGGKSSAKPLVISTWNDGKLVNAAAWRILETNGRALDAVESGARLMEARNSCCVGLDGYPDRDGIVTLDACIMDEQGNCGSVAALEQVRHPVSVARKVMEQTPHIMLAGTGAQEFAFQNGFKKEDATISPEAATAYREWLKTSQYKPSRNIENSKGKGPFAPGFLETGEPNHDTMGLLALDNASNLSGAVTTSGLAFKLHGRVGDSPIIGAGLFVDNEVGAAASTGIGEEVIRICGAHTVVELMRAGLSPESACRRALDRIVKRDRKKASTIQVAFIAVNKNGEHGAYALTKGFTYCVKTNGRDESITAKSIFG